jgi:hypothetical protein
MPVDGRTMLTVGGVFTAFVTVIRFTRFVADDPPGPETVSATENTPAFV